MSRTSVIVTIQVNVHDPESFAKAARAMALTDGYTRQEAELEFTADNLTGCAQMLLDPGEGPDGSSIGFSEAAYEGELP